MTFSLELEKLVEVVRMHETVQTVEFRPIYREEFQTALNLAWRTFLQFEAADYEEEGMRSFISL